VPVLLAAVLAVVVVAFAVEVVVAAPRRSADIAPVLICAVAFIEALVAAVGLVVTLPSSSSPQRTTSGASSFLVSARSVSMLGRRRTVEVDGTASALPRLSFAASPVSVCFN
jgi:hypothetical protein